MRILWTFVFLCFLVCTGCSAKRVSAISVDTGIAPVASVPSLPIQGSSPQEANNFFAFSIFEKVNSGSKSDENLFISPLSITYALSMTLNGANGETGAAMKEVLGYQDYSNKEINTANSDLSKILFGQSTGVTISTANSIWSVNTIPVKKSFIDVLNDYYSAESKSFSPNDPNIVSRINGWIEDKTNGMIKEMVNRLDPSIAVMLINAVCFEGEWSNGFDENRTVDADFYLSDGQTKTVKMMEQTNDFKVYEGDNFSMVELAYGEGDYVIDVILPDKATGIDGFMTQFSQKTFSVWLESLEHKTTQLSLPKFKYSYRSELNDILSDMGMGIAFGGSADFSGIAEGGQFSIDEVLHQAFIETNEKGTKAAAATIVGVKMVSMRPEDPFVFKADHPFLYVIRETSTNTILFMGKTVNP